MGDGSLSGFELLVERQEAALRQLQASTPDGSADGTELARWWDSNERGPQMRFAVSPDADPDDPDEVSGSQVGR